MQGRSHRSFRWCPHIASQRIRRWLVRFPISFVYSRLRVFRIDLLQWIATEMAKGSNSIVLSRCCCAITLSWSTPMRRIFGLMKHLGVDLLVSILFLDSEAPEGRRTCWLLIVCGQYMIGIIVRGGSECLMTNVDVMIGTIITELFNELWRYRALSSIEPVVCLGWKGRLVVWVRMLNIFRGTSDLLCRHREESRVQNFCWMWIRRGGFVDRVVFCMIFCFKNWLLLADDLQVFLRKFESENGSEKKGHSAEILQ